MVSLHQDRSQSCRSVMELPSSTRIHGVNCKMFNVNTIRRYAVACLCASFIGAVLSDCPIPEKHPNNGRMRFQYRRDVNMTIAPENYLLRFQCNEGFVLKGAKAIVCVSDEWTKEVPVCSKMSCADPPSILNGDYLLETGVSEELFIGSIATYNCNDGYEFKNNSNSILTCHLFDDINDAQWKGELPTCIEKESCGSWCFNRWKKGRRLLLYWRCS
ncbi:CUB and sushi domain-containing protein 3 [Trichonephila inaurata madagascariensis]|uniref:CUB and sushi domain-containing protein 3 n=1 Tax=Trichonephila inaurata madagascariensis TaxID=2747483 RepID=A0A8X6Y968_9ARAC|nr:CUB and sushi domain-containing protein 3 [Trichonephila inaurata madagascariensis]